VGQPQLRAVLPILRLPDVYALVEPLPRWKCGDCRRKFSFMPGIVFHSRTPPVRDYLAMFAVFPRPPKGRVRLTDEAHIDVEPKGAFVPLHKARDPTVVVTASSCAFSRR
jgi:hypothetical protein